MGEQVYRLRHVLHFLRLSQVAMKKRLRHARFVVVALLLGGAACAGALFLLATECGSRLWHWQCADDVRWEWTGAALPADKNVSRRPATRHLSPELCSRAAHHLQ